MYSIGIGRTHTGTRVIVLAQDLDIRIIDAATGELLRELDPRHIQALPRHRTPTRPHPLKSEGRTHVYWVRPSAMS